MLLNRRADAADRLTEFAETVKTGQKKDRSREVAWRDAPVDQRLKHALLTGTVDFIDRDVEEASRKLYDRPLAIIEGPLMEGMNVVGDLFGGQDVPSPGGQERPGHEEGRRLPDAVHGGGEGQGDRRRRRRVAAPIARQILMATVKGDVHDIGKNIVGVVLACNDYEVIDLGVMVPCEDILQKAPEAGWT